MLRSIRIMITNVTFFNHISDQDVENEDMLYD